MQGDTAPYVGFGSFSRALALLRTENIASITDVSRHIDTKLSTGVKNQVLTAFRFFKLIDKKNRPTDNLQKLFATWEDAVVHRQILREMIVESYRISRDLSVDGSIARSGLERISSGFSDSDRMRAKIKKFFTEICESAGIETPTEAEPGTQNQTSANLDSRGTASRVGSSKSWLASRNPPQAARRPISNIPNPELQEQKHLPLIAHDLITQILEYRQPPPDDRPSVYRTLRWLAQLSATE